MENEIRKEETDQEQNRDLRSKSDCSAGLDAMQQKLKERVRVLENTIKTFLHDLDDSEVDESMPKVLMTNGMWMQVAAFRKLVGSI